MSSSPSDLRRLTPWMREVDAALDANEDKLEEQGKTLAIQQATLGEHALALAKQEAKLSEHDKAFAQFHRDLELMKNMFQAQIDHIDRMLERNGYVKNGR